MRQRRFIITWAQNATPVHAGFLESLQHYPARLVVLKGRYKNPTSVWTEGDKDDQWYAPELVSYLTEDRGQLCRNLCMYGDVHVRPTAVRPLTGFEVFCGQNSGIFGHPKRALEVIPTASRMPRILVTTGACTVENYTDSKAGKKGEAHHVIGALVVEIEPDGIYHLRHVAAEPSGAFIDLDKRYTPDGVQAAPRALALTLGDLHAGQEDEPTLEATRELIDQTQPQNVFLHDVLDFRSRNHHDAKSLRKSYAKLTEGRSSVKREVQGAVQALRDVASWGPHNVVVVRSNHDEAFDRWLEESSPHLDPENAEYYFAVWSRLFRFYDRNGYFPDAFPLEARRLGVPASVRFLRRDDDVKLKGVSYGFHGDKGINGSRGTPHAYARLGTKTVTGHTHTPCIRDGNYSAGVTAKLDQGYNNLPGTWLHAHVVQYANGKRALILIIKGAYTLQQYRSAA